MLCFGFVTKTELITELCFGCHWTILAECQGFLFFPTHSQWVGCVLARNWKETQTDQLTRTSQKGMPYHACHILSYLACNKAEVAKQILFVCFSRVAVTERVSACGRPQFVCGRCWLIFFFSFFLHLLIEDYVFISAHEFLAFMLLIVSSIPLGREE